MFNELVSTADIDQTSKSDLGNNGTEFSAGSRDTVAGGAITGGEHLTRDNKGGGVRAEVLEEVGKAIQEHENFGRARVGGELIVSETCKRDRLVTTRIL